MARVAGLDEELLFQDEGCGGIPHRLQSSGYAIRQIYQRAAWRRL